MVFPGVAGITGVFVGVAVGGTGVSVGASGVPVGVGTGVTTEYENGRQETFYILGDWDRDEELGIISSTTKMAEALLGKPVDATVLVPAEDGEVSARITNVSPLTEEILAWCVFGADAE